jgi:hypothetical protein
MSEPSCRLAGIGDAAEIHDLLLRAAGEIPLQVETLEQEEALYAAVRKVLAFGQSWIAVDGGRVVGCVLVESAEVGRHWGENELLNLRYAAGAALEALIGKVVERPAPITASVRDVNRSGLAALLERHGFRETEKRLGERRFRRNL